MLIAEMSGKFAEFIERVKKLKKLLAFQGLQRPLCQKKEEEKAVRLTESASHLL